MIGRLNTWPITRLFSGASGASRLSSVAAGRRHASRTRAPATTRPLASSSARWRQRQQSDECVRRPSTAFHRPSTAFHRPSTAFHRPSTAFHRPSTAFHQPSTAFHQVRAARGARRLPLARRVQAAADRRACQAAAAKWRWRRSRSRRGARQLVAGARHHRQSLLLIAYHCS